MFEQLNNLAHTLERMFTLYQRAMELLDAERKSLAKMNFEELYAELREKDEVLSILRRLDKERLKVQDHFAMLNRLDPSEVTLKFIGDHLVQEGGASAVLGNRLLLIRARIQGVVAKIKERVSVNETFIEKSVQNIRALAEIYTQAFTNESPSRAPLTTYTGKRVIQKAPQSAGKILEKRL
jgi:hypothetical protein